MAISVFPGCSKRYARKFCLSKHQKIEHGIEDNHQCTRNFQCPFSCHYSEGQGASFRTNIELLNHCEKFHDDELGWGYIASYVLQNSNGTNLVCNLYAQGGSL